MVACISFRKKRVVRSNSWSRAAGVFDHNTRLSRATLPDCRMSVAATKVPDSNVLVHLSISLAQKKLNCVTKKGTKHNKSSVAQMNLEVVSKHDLCKLKTANICQIPGFRQSSKVTLLSGLSASTELPTWARDCLSKQTLTASLWSCTIHIYMFP